MAVNPEELHQPHESPGPLRSAAVLTLQTKEAQKLILGRTSETTEANQNIASKSEYIMGLQDFGRRMNRIWLAAQQDDPYADWYLWKIEAALHTAKVRVSTQTEELSQLLDSMQAIKIKISQSTDPINIELNFANPYGYIAAYLVAEFDALACRVLTAWHIGLLDRAPGLAMLNTTSGFIRTSFGLSSHWHFTGVTRAAVHHNDSLAQQAKARMGKLPQEIIDLQQRAKMAPEIKLFSLSPNPSQTESILVG